MTAIFTEHLTNMLDLSVKAVDKAYSHFEYIEDDEDLTGYPIEEIQIEYRTLTIYIEVELKNDAIEVIYVLVTDQNDCKNKIFTNELSPLLINHYNKESVSLAIKYSQNLEIAHDQSDPHNLRPAMPLSHDNIVKYRKQIYLWCSAQPIDQELPNLFKYGTAGKRFKTSASTQKIVNTMIELIDANVFSIIRKKHKPIEKAKFLDSIFYKEGKNIIKNYQRSISNYYSIRA